MTNALLVGKKGKKLCHWNWRKGGNRMKRQRTAEIEKRIKR